MSLNLDKSTWKRVTFGDVVRNANESVRNLDEAGIDRIIAMEHLDPGELKISRWGSTENGTTFTRRVKPGQTLFGKRRAYQRKVAYAEFDAICSGDIYTFEADEAQMLGEFLPFLVQSNEFFDHALGTSAGSLSPRTNWRDLADFAFDLPPLDEQKRIADLLWAIELHRRALTDRRQTLEASLVVVLDETYRATKGVAVAIDSLCTDIVGGVWGCPKARARSMCSRLDRASTHRVNRNLPQTAHQFAQCLSVKPSRAWCVQMTSSLSVRVVHPRSLSAGW